MASSVTTGRGTATDHGILIAGIVVDNGGNTGFGAGEVWLYPTVGTVGYMISRGLAKAGSRDPYAHDRDGR